MGFISAILALILLTMIFKKANKNKEKGGIENEQQHLESNKSN